MDFKDLLRLHGYDPDARHEIGLLRHRPYEPDLARAMPWLLEERPELFEAYQSVPGSPERSLLKTRFVASFLGLAPGTAHFVGLYRIRGHRFIDFDTFWSIPENQELARYGYAGFTPEELKNGVKGRYQFDLELLPFYREWRGRLIISFPPPERAWFRRMERGSFPVKAILEQSAFVAPPPDWRELVLSFDELFRLPSSWRVKLSEWRGIYLIFDVKAGKGYVGAAYGEENILGRWQSYAKSGHGGNRELRHRDPRDFRFSILERLSPDASPEDVMAREASWKRRLHTRWPYGLNRN